MEKKNTVLLTVIAVATLLVAVVGATFAYFTASTNATGNGDDGAANVTTQASIGGVNLTMAGTTTNSDATYPGGYVVAGSSVTATSTGTQNYNLTYKVNGTITNGTGTELTYKVYRFDSAIAGDTVSGCKLRTYAVGTETRYTYYNDGNTETTCKLNDTLANASGNAVLVDNGTVVAGGNATIALENEKLTSSTDGTAAYYYVSVYYKDTTESQNADMGKSITAQFTNVTDSTAVAVQ